MAVPRREEVGLQIFQGWEILGDQYVVEIKAANVR